MAEVVTGEAVVLDVPIAAFPSRMVAVLLDMLLQYTALVIMSIVIVTIQVNGAALAAIASVVVVSIFIGYPTIFETVSRGKTLGKMAMGLRVVSDDGGPERFRQALIRALTGLFEFTVLAPVALFTSLLSARGKRLGDMFAGTFVIQERVPRPGNLTPEFMAVPPPLADWARVADISALSDGNAEAASSYLRRYYDLQQAARDDLGARLAATVASQVSPQPPAGTPAPAYLSAVLAIRRERDRARFAAAHQPAAAGPPGKMSQADIASAPGIASQPAAASQSEASPPAGFAGPAGFAEPAGFSPPD